MRLAVACSLAVLAATAARAQGEKSTGVGNPAVTAPDTMRPPGAPSPQQPNTADRTFVQMAAMGGAAEVALGRLAVQRGANPAVREFGERMVADHSRADERLGGLARGDGVALPKGPDAEHRAMLEQLQQAQGAAFDRAYIHGQIVDHQLTAQLLEYEIGSGQDMRLKAFASEALPQVMQHLQMAQGLDARLTGAARPEAAIAGERAPPSAAAGGSENR